MKTRNSVLRRQMILPGIAIGIAAIVALFSCKKQTSEATPDKDSMTAAAKVTGGDLLKGSVHVETDDELIGLRINNDSRDVLISSIPGSRITGIRSIASAEVITSKHGVILKDLSNGEVFFLMNNDPESMAAFDAARPYFTSGVRSNKIFGITIVNNERS